MRRFFKRHAAKSFRSLLPAMLMCLASAVAAEQAALTDFDGQPRSITDYTGDGRWLVVMIWAHDCHVCNQEAENYAQFHVEREDTDARVLGVSMDGEANKAAARGFIERHDLPFPNLIGELPIVAMQFQALTGESFRGTPSLLLYGPDGKLRAAQAGAVPVSSIDAYIARNSG